MNDDGARLRIHALEKRMHHVERGIKGAAVWVLVLGGLVVAAVLVSFHSAFQIRTPIAATSTVSLALVVITGIIGRFLFALAPAGSRERLRIALDSIELALPESHEGLEAFSAFLELARETS